jgi:Pvc16 N-terminal domain
VIEDADDVLRGLVQRCLGKGLSLSFEPPAVARDAAQEGTTVLDAHLVAIEEQRDLSSSGFARVSGPDGTFVQRPPRYIKLTYWLSAWGGDAVREHAVLGALLTGLAGVDYVAKDDMPARLRESDLPVGVSVATGQSVGQRLADVWSSLGEPMKAGMELILLLPVSPAPAAETAALVLERQLRMTGPPIPRSLAPPAPQGIPNVLAAPPTALVPHPPVAGVAPAAGTAASAGVAPAPAGVAAGAAAATPVGTPAPASTAPAQPKPPLIEQVTYGPDPDAPPELCDPGADNGKAPNNGPS